MSDDDSRHSGSRWEPGPSEPARSAGQADPGDHPDTAPTTRVAVAAPRRNRRRAGLLAAAAAGLLAAGGLGGYAVGHASASAPSDGAGFPGAGVGFGHHHGSVGPDGTLPGGPGTGETGTRRGGAST